MENWKIVAIVACLSVPVLYSVYQENQPTLPPTPEDLAASRTPQPTPTPPPFFGKVLPQWKIAPAMWINSAKEIKVEDLRGTTSMVEIFRINCGHCQEVAPLLQGLYQRYNARGLKIVALQSPGLINDSSNSENDLAAVKTWVKERNLTYPIGQDAGSAYFQKKLKGTLYPTTMLLDKDGKVIFHQTGHDAAKGLRLAATLEKKFPGSGTPEANAKALAAWLRKYPEFQAAGTDMEAEVLKVLQAK